MNKIVLDRGKFKVPLEEVKIHDRVLEFTCNGEYCLDLSDNEHSDIEIIVRDNVCIKLLIYSEGGKNFSHIVYRLGYRSNAMLFKFFYNEKVDSEEEIYLDGMYSAVSYNFSSICRKEEDYHLKIFHNESKVSSFVSNRCMGDDYSKIRFVIDSILDKGNVGCVMDQNTKVMCQGDVDARICPNMFILENDVVANHGSVIGRFSDDAMFYLMSRGICEEDAVKLLVRGFILSNLPIDCEYIHKIIQIVEEHCF